MQVNKVQWINVAKFVAILAVLVDHSNGVLYTDRRIALMSYFSVSLFIFLAGITAYWSNSRIAEKDYPSWYDATIRRIKKIFFPYVFATVLYQVAATHCWSFDIWILNLIHFNASGPLYFVALYMQLLLVSPLLYCCIEYAGRKQYPSMSYILLLSFILYVCFLTTNFTQVMDIYGGGGKLLGGTYLFLYALGMLAGKYHSKIIEICNKGKVFISIGLFYVVWELVYFKHEFYLEKYVPFGGGINPPSVTGMMHALIVGVLICAVSCNTNRISAKIISVLSRGGGHSLYIFLFHRLWLNFFLRPYIIIENQVLRAFVYIGIMILGSIFLEYVSKSVVRYVNEHIMLEG